MKSKRTNKQEVVSKKTASKYLSGLVIFIALLFGSGILTLSIWKASITTLRISTYRVPPTIVNDGVENGGEAESGYQLPVVKYLPGQPVYYLKMIQDRVSLWLTPGGKHKAELLMGYADERIATAEQLLDRGEAGIGVTTAGKGEKYFQQAIDEMRRAEKRGENVTDLREKMAGAIFKHHEILSEMQGELQGHEPAGLQDCLLYNQLLGTALQQ
jgi:hypothetical protein